MDDPLYLLGRLDGLRECLPARLRHYVDTASELVDRELARRGDVPLPVADVVRIGNDIVDALCPPTPEGDPKPHASMAACVRNVTIRSIMFGPSTVSVGGGGDHVRDREWFEAELEKAFGAVPWALNGTFETLYEVARIGFLNNENFVLELAGTMMHEEDDAVQRRCARRDNLTRLRVLVAAIVAYVLLLRPSVTGRADERMLQGLAQLATDYELVLKRSASIVIKKCYKGWRMRMEYAFNPHTRLGAYYVRRDALSLGCTMD